MAKNSREFKIGDVVVIKNYITLDDEGEDKILASCVGKVGIIEDLDIGDKVPFLVNIFGVSERYWFHKRELTLATKAAKVLYGVK